MIRQKHPRLFISKAAQKRRQRETYQAIRDLMPTACISVCYAVKVSPTSDNIVKARQTIYKWARARYSEWKEAESLLESLGAVAISTTVVGLPVCEWRSNSNGGRYPAIRWPEEKSPDKQRAVINEWNRLALRQTDRLWEWYDSQAK